MKSLFNAYRVLAFVVGILLLIGVVAIVLKYGLSEGSTMQTFGKNLSIVWLFHGWIYIVYVVVAFILSRRAGWSLPFLGLMLIAGLVPGLIFWVEHHVVEKLRAERPELLAIT